MAIPVHAAQPAGSAGTEDRGRKSAAAGPAGHCGGGSGLLVEESESACCGVTVSELPFLGGRLFCFAPALFHEGLEMGLGYPSCPLSANETKL